MINWLLTRGLLKLTARVRVDIPAADSTARKELDTPMPIFSASVESEIQRPASVTVPCNRDETDQSEMAKSRPDIVSETPAVAGTLERNTELNWPMSKLREKAEVATC